MNKRKKKKAKTKSFDSSFESGSMDMVFENNFSGTVKHFSEGASAMDDDMEPTVSNLSPQDDRNLGIASLASLTDLSPYDFDPSKADMTDNSDMFCDGPGARTRSKMGQDNDTNSNDLTTTDAKQHIPAPSFLVQIPFYAYKKEKNRKCSVCGKHGRTPSDLLRHMRVHTGERPFPCVGCDKRFKCKRSQLTHQYLTHGIKEGLSDHRLQVLESKKMRHRTKKGFLEYEIPPTLLENQVQILPEQEPPIRPVSVDQDEDTEIMAEDEQQTTSTNGDVKTSFEGLFSPLSEDQCPLLGEQSGIMTQTQVMNDCSNLNYSVGETSRIEEEEEGLISENREEIKKESPTFDIDDMGRIGPAQSVQPGSPKVPILRIKTHKCSYCKRQFRSIYTLRYHLRSMHDEKVYLSPALETRLKKRRWLPPHVRLQKSKLLALSSLLKSKALAKEKKSSSNASTSKIQEKVQVEEQNIPIQGETFLSPEKEPDTEKVPELPEQKQMELPELCEIKKDSLIEASKMFLPNIKTEKQDPMIEELNLARDLLNDVNNNSSTLRSILTSKESIFNPISHYNSSLSNQIPLFSNSNYSMNGNTTTNSKSGTNPYVVPPHIFLPSNPQLEEGLQNNQPISWESLHVTSENVLVTKMEAVHPTTHQKYVLYKCSHCGKAYSGLRAIGMHLASHSDIAGKDCEKCGASFKWRNELDSHLECHRADRKFIPSSPFLPSYYVNPFPIPVLPTNEQTVMSTPGLLSYPFFPMPQQIPPLVQPGFFPFFAAALQPPSQMQSNDVASATSVNNATHSVSEELKNNLDEKNVDQNCTFQCKLCPKTFDRIFSLQRHERIHSGVKACFCKTCGRGFSELRNLRHHIVRFHAEAAKMEPLPYRRQPTRMRNSSQRLVSFLKKTAVRILNSMGQNKLDGSASSVKIQTDEYSMSKNDHVEETAQNLSTKDNRHPSPEDKTNDPESNISLHREGDHPREVSPPNSLANKQNYLQVPELDDLPTLSTRASVIQEAAKNSSQSKAGSNSGRQLEVLQDPKRSLLGNRRKGRPFKLTTNTCNFLNPLSDENLYAITQNILNGMPKLSLEQPGAFLQASQAAVSTMPNELNMPQLSFFNSEPPAIEPIDMRNVKDVKPREEVKPEPVVNTEPVKVDSTISTTNFPTFGLDAVSALNVNASVLSSSDGKPTMFPCNYCNRSFSSLSDLNRHMSFHADIRPFKCPYCSYCSRTNSQLKVHMMRHEGIKHYMCQICNYNGVTQSDLNRHLKTRTHLLRSRNVCACCGTGFHTRSLSEEHYKSCRLLANSGNKDQNKAPQEPQGRLTLENRHRGNRLKHVQKPKEDRPKTDFFQKLCDLRKMGIPFGDFLPPNSSANAVK